MYLSFDQLQCPEGCVALSDQVRDVSIICLPLGTEVWGWEKYPYLNRLGRKAGFPEGQEQDKKHKPPPWTSLHCTMIVSHLVLIFDSELLHREEGHICYSHNVSRRWLSLDFTHLKREEKRIPKYLGLVAMWHLL